MKKYLLPSLAFVLFLGACSTNKEVVTPPNQVQLLNGEGLKSQNFTEDPGNFFDVKLWIYAHYNFNKIVVSSQVISPFIGQEGVVETIVEVPGAIAFSSNYTTTLESLRVTNISNAKQKFIFTITDNKGKTFSRSILATTTFFFDNE